MVNIPSDNRLYIFWPQKGKVGSKGEHKRQAFKKQEPQRGFSSLGQSAISLSLLSSADLCYCWICLSGTVDKRQYDDGAPQLHGQQHLDVAIVSPSPPKSQAPPCWALTLLLSSSSCSRAGRATHFNAFQWGPPGYHMVLVGGRLEWDTSILVILVITNWGSNFLSLPTKDQNLATLFHNQRLV